MSDRRSTGFHSGTRLDRARAALRGIVSPHGRTDRLPLAAADGRVLASPVAARADAPPYARAALDGFAIRARDAEGASEDDPATLARTEGSVSAGEAARVHTGSEIPEGADAVVRVERATVRDDSITLSRAVPGGNNVAPVGEDVRAGQHLYDPGHRLRPSDLGLLKSAGVREVAVYGPPRVSVLPTGGELVDADPEPGETVETNGLAVSRLVERWGGEPRHRGAVPDDADALRRAIRDASGADAVATIGGSSVGERDLVPGVVDATGDLAVHGVSVKPGHPVGVGVVDGTPVVLLPGYPVSCIVNAVQFLRPALAWLVGARPKPFPTVRATLADPIESEPGVRRFARVRLRPADPGTGDEVRTDAPDGTRRDDREPNGALDADGTGAVATGRIDGANATGTAWTDPRGRRPRGDDADALVDPAAVPTTGSGAGVLSSVALADGWVEVPEDAGDVPAGSTVAVQDWEWHP